MQQTPMPPARDPVNEPTHEARSTRPRRPPSPARGSQPALAPTALLLALLPGCTVGPDYRPPDVQTPSEWVGPGSSATTRPSTTTTDAPDVAEWWTNFNDTLLDSLIARAVNDNLDLQVAASRIRQARAARVGTASVLYPNADVSGSFRRSTSGGDDATGRDDRTYRSSFSGGLDASWEIDIFGGNRRSVEAADAEIRSAIENRRDVLVTLTSEVALAYLDLRGLQNQIDIARQNLVSQRKSLDMTRRQAAGGVVTRLDVVNAEGQVAATESAIPSLESQVRQAIYALSFLLGREPGALLEELTPPGPIPRTPAVIPIGLPSDLLRRRPDVRRAEADLHSATARVGVATSDLFPRFSLTGSLGVSGDKARALSNWNNLTASIGPSVSWPLFDAGRIRSNINVQTAAQEQALLAYRQTVLLALREVEVALVAYAKEQERRKWLAEAVTADRAAVDLSRRAYDAGQTDFINVLNAQRSLLSSEDALTRSDQAIATNLIALYKALGGGWEFELPPP